MAKITDLIKKEEKRQMETINLIPSENYISTRVLEALGSVFTNKYCEGYSNNRYYTGAENFDLIEERTIALAKELFRTDYGVNVQAYSGCIANLAIYNALLKTDDKVLAMDLTAGGHISHGHSVSFTSQIYNFIHYGVNRQSEILDYEAILAQAKKEKPRLIVCGASAYPREIDFAAFARIAKQVSAYLLADISHIGGLAAAGFHPSPFGFADVIMTTTQKTLRGPRGALIFSRPQLSERIDRAIFPGLQGGPHGHTIAAIGVALEEAIQPSFKKYIQQIIANSQALAKELSRQGFRLVSGGTDNHLILIDLKKNDIGGKEASERLEEVGITVNKNTIPFDEGTSQNPSGIRLGTPAVTARGMKEKEMIQIARLIAETLSDNPDLKKISQEVLDLTKRFPMLS